jgi:hypothetical protein
LAKSAIICAYCGKGALKENSAIARARRGGFTLYCDRTCAGKGRSFFLPPSQRKAEKATYDADYRRKNRTMLKAKKAARHKRTYDPEKAREERKANMPRHVEYCRRPAYRKYKAQYDRHRRAKQQFGEFWEAALILQEIEGEVLSRATRYELDMANDRLNKKKRRSRHGHISLPLGG